MRQPRTLLEQSLRQAVGRVARRDVEQDRIARSRHAGGERIRREDGVESAERRDALAIGIRTMDDAHLSACRDRRQVDGEAGDVMRAADDHRARAVLARERRCRIEGAAREPRSRQAIAVPELSRRARFQQRRLARCAHAAFGDLVEIRREQREAVRGVAHQVGVDEQFGDRARDVVAHARFRKQGCGQQHERCGVVADARRLRVGVVHAWRNGLQGTGGKREKREGLGKLGRF